jgi:glucose-6-phosphate 1-dehydrogenase
VTAAPASLLTIFGATGDLARRMLLPSLYSLQAEQLLPANLRILGTARSELDRDGFANLVSASIAERIPAAERDDAALRGLLDRLDYADRRAWTTMRRWRLPRTHEALRDGDVLYHLSTAPRSTARPASRWPRTALAGAGTRVMLEKPIGKDLASAIAINDGVAMCLRRSAGLSASTITSARKACRT